MFATMSCQDYMTKTILVAHIVRFVRRPDYVVSFSCGYHQLYWSDITFRPLPLCIGHTNLNHVFLVEFTNCLTGYIQCILEMSP